MRGDYFMCCVVFLAFLVVGAALVGAAAQEGQTAQACNNQNPTDDVAYVACLVGGLRMAELVDLPALQERIDNVLAALSSYTETGERDENWTANVREAGRTTSEHPPFRAQLYIETNPPDADVVCWPDLVSGGAVVEGAIRSFVFDATPSGEAGRDRDSVRFMCAGVGLFGGLKSAGGWSW